MAIHIQWKSGYRAKGNAESVYAELEAMRKRDGVLLPPKIVEAARDEDSAMHGEFEWDDSKAAEQHRLSQARLMTRSIEVIRVEAPHLKPSSKYVHITTRDTPEQKPVRAYTDKAEALRDPVTRHEVLSRCINEALAFRRKYAELQELAKVFEAMDEFVVEFKGVGN